MVLVTSGAGLVIEIGLAVFCFLDLCLTPERAARWLPRWGWALVVLVFPLVGAVGWLVAGRPWRSGQRSDRTATSALPLPEPPPAATRPAHRPGVPGGTGASAVTARTVMPRHATADARMTLLDELWAVNAEHERTLRSWEADLRRREEALRLLGPTALPADDGTAA